MEIKIGDLRLIPKETGVFSITNQRRIFLDEDAIVEIKHTCYDSDIVFVKPKQLLFNCPGFITGLIGLGGDEWSISYSQTLPYSIPIHNFKQKK